jgi:gluconolactonase
VNFETMADGLMFPEGPVAMEDGSVLVAEIAGARLTRVRPNGVKERVAELGGGPNGAALGPDGAVYVCNNGGMGWVREGTEVVPTGAVPAEYRSGSIQKVDPGTGSFTVLYSECEGIPLYSPNDLIFDRTGGFWFTDHGKNLAAGRTQGALYYAAADGSHIRRAAIATSPNGIGLSPDETTLFVADTNLAHVTAFGLAAPGELATSKPTIMCSVSDTHRLDSLAVGTAGEVYVAALLPGGIITVTSQGVVSDVPLPDPYVTNICFGGPTMSTAYVTLSQCGRLLRVDGLGVGLKLNFAY